MNLDEQFFFKYYLHLDPNKLTEDEIKLITEKLKVKDQHPMKTSKFPSKCRFTLESKTFPELAHYVLNVDLDCFNKSLDLAILDAVVDDKPVVLDWIIKTINSPGKENLTIHQYDVDGKVLYTKLLKKIKLIGHRCNHNYCAEDNKDLQDHELMFTYEELDIITEVI